MWYWTWTGLPLYFWKASLVGANIVKYRNSKFDIAILLRSIKS